MLCMFERACGLVKGRRINKGGCGIQNRHFHKQGHAQLKLILIIPFGKNLRKAQVPELVNRFFIENNIPKMQEQRKRILVFIVVINTKRKRPQGRVINRSCHSNNMII